jgi:hypothetical protein
MTSSYKRSPFRSDHFFIINHSHQLPNHSPHPDDGYISPSFLCGKISIAHSQNQMDLVCNLVAQLSTHISIDCPDEIPGLLEENIVPILFSLLQQGGHRRATALNCLVNISCIIPMIFECPAFLCSLAALFSKDNLTAKEKVSLLTFLRNILYNNNPNIQSVIRQHFPISLFSILIATANGEVIFAVLECLKQFAKFPVDRESFYAILQMIKSTREQPNDECSEKHIQIMVWTMIYFIQSESFNLADFCELEFPQILQKSLESSLEKCVVLGSRLLRMLIANYSVQIRFRMERVLEVFLKSKVEENAAVCGSAFGLVLERQIEDSMRYLREGLFENLLRMFENRGIRCKVAMIRMFFALVQTADIETFSMVIIELPGVNETVFSLCWQLFEMREIEICEGCLHLFIAIFEKAECFGMMKRCIELFQRKIHEDFTFEDELFRESSIQKLTEHLNHFLIE